MQQYRRIPPSKVPLTWIVPFTAVWPVGVGQVPVGGGVVGGGVVGGGVVGGRVVGGAVVVGFVTPPVHVTPLTAKLVGAGLLLLFQLALKPNDVAAFVARLPL
jgi:hypothetical protein